MGRIPHLLKCILLLVLLSSLLVREVVVLDRFNASVKFFSLSSRFSHWVCTILNGYFPGSDSVLTKSFNS